MSTKGNSGGDDFDAFEDDFFKDGEDDSFWDDDKVDAYDASAAIPKSQLKALRESLEDEGLEGGDGADAAADASESEPAAPAVPAPRAEAFVPPAGGGQRETRDLPPVPRSPFMMTLPKPPAAAPATGDERDNLGDRALFSSPTLILPRDEDEPEVPAPPADAESVPPPPEVPSAGGDLPPAPGAAEPPGDDSADEPLAMGDAETAAPVADDAMMFGETVGAAAVVPSDADLDARLDGGVMDEDAAHGDADSDATVADEDLPTEMADRPAPAPRQLDADEFQYTEEELRIARDERAARQASAAPDAGAPVGVAPEIAAPAPVTSTSSVPGYEPATGDAGTWGEAALALEREASVADEPALKGRLLAAAGRIHFARCGDWDAAARCFAAALETGEQSKDVFAALGHVVASRQSFEELRDLLVRRAEVTGGGEAAEALHDAALVTRNHLRDDAETVALLGRALEHVPHDWFSLRLLREQLYRTEDWTSLVDLLGRMADVVGGSGAARLLVEKGRVLEQRLERESDAHAAYVAARAADPSSVEAFLSLERHALAGGDHAALAVLYREEATALAGADSAFFSARAARAAARAGDTEAATADWAAAIESAGSGSIELLHEQQAFFSSIGAHESLRDSLAAEAENTEGGARASALLRLAQLLEGPLEDAEGALSAYRDVLAADPSATPAGEAVSRLLRATGRNDELLEFMTAQVDGIEDPNLRVTALYRMAELCEGPMADRKAARTWYEQILEAAPGYLPALEGLERVYTHLEEWAHLATIYERRAELAADGAGSALQLHRAGSVLENRIGDAAQGLVFYKRALEHAPDFPPSLDAHNRLSSDAGDWGAVADALLAAAAATADVNTEVSLTYRAARVLADHVDNPQGAMEALRRCLLLSPGFRPAILLQRDLASAASAWKDVYDLQRLEAEATEDPARRAWRMLVAADAATRIDEVDSLGVIRGVLDEAPTHPGALAALELEAHRTGDLDTVLLLLRQRAARAEDDAVRARVGARMADAAAEAGDETAAVQALSEVAHAESDGRPLLALARLAERLGFWEEAERALAAAGAVEQRARLMEVWSKDTDAIVAGWRAAFEADGAGIAAASGLERSLSRAGLRDGLAAAHAGIADAAGSPAVTSVHALLAGHLMEAEGDVDGARARYEAAFAVRPVGGKAFDALRRLSVQAADADAIATLYGRLDDPDPVGLLDALEGAEANDAAADVLKARLADSPGDLEALVHLEQVLAASERWKEAFEMLGERLAVTGSEEERQSISGKRRWILAEHLADTDEAWDFYRQLHEETPEDAGVLEALARIAGARGETGLAVEYLEGLASRATGADAARFQRRIAEVHARSGDSDAVLAALMRALDLHPEDLEALAQLREFHTEAEDWRALVGVLAREATVVDGDAQVACYRQIASVWEDRLAEPAVAMDAWRKVLDVSPDDAVGLEHLVELSRASGDWASLAEHGEAWLRHVPDEGRVALQSELGQVYANHLRREDEALRFLHAATSGDAPDLEAARLYERIYESRGNWSEAVEGILRQARASEGATRVEHYLRAAQRRIETLHDRDGAAEIYRRVLEVDDAHGEALRFLGDHLYDAGDLSAAVDIYARMVEGESKRDLDDFDVQIEVALFFYRFAESLRQLDRQEEALERYEQGLQLNPSHLPSLEAVGPLYMDGERWDDAAKVYRQILQLTGGQGDPERLARTYTNLGKVEFHIGNLDKAKKRFNKALELRANDIRALQGIASVLFARSDWNNLLNVYNNIIYHAQEPGEVVDAYLTKGFVLDAKMGLPDKARQHYEKSLAFDPGQPAALLRLAELALRQQDWPEAAATADRGLALTPEDTRVLTGLHLVKVVAHGAGGDADAAAEARTAADAADATLADVLTGDASAWEQVHEVLRTRLQSQL